jgi:ABC-type uncharacterized transport system ATPase subunit
MVHQHFMLIQAMSVAENIALGLKHLNFLFPLKRVREKLLTLPGSMALTFPLGQKSGNSRLVNSNVLKFSEF